MELFEKISDYISDSGISAALNGAASVLCAFSGGADSSFLLHFLCKYLEGSGKSLYAAHMNHKIRGDEAERDEAFCREAAEALGIGFFSGSADIPALAEKSGLGLEECARHERYAFLRETARSLGQGTVIAVAHSATDNLETVLFHLLRGSGTRGMAGISPVSADGIIRPLLCCSSEEIRAAASAAGLSYVCDSTNGDESYTRNFIRHRIIPEVRKINPGADAAVLRLSENARADDDYITSAAAEIIRREDGCAYIRRTDISDCHRAVSVRAISMLYTDADGSAKDLTERHLSAAYELSGRSGGRLSFPRGLTMYADTDRIYFSRSTSAIPPITETVLAEEGKMYTFGEIFAAAYIREEKNPIWNKNIYNLFIQQTASFDRIYGSLFIRTRREGDTLLHGGMHKKLKKLMCDSKIPRRYREQLPVFCDDEGILWLPGASPRDGALNPNSTKDTVKLFVFIKKGAENDKKTL